MKNTIRTSLSILAVSALAACATSNQPGGVDQKTAGAATGAALGCLGGALLAKVTNQNAMGGCLVGGVAGGFIGFEKARNEEIAAANKAREEALAAMAKLPRTPGGAQAHAGEVKTVEVTATDKQKGESRKIQAFDSVTVDLPASARGTPQYNEAVGKLKTLAERVADERGQSSIDIAMTAADARANKVQLETATARTAKGSPIVVTKVADNSVPAGIERYTVRAGALKSLDV